MTSPVRQRWHYWRNLAVFTFFSVVFACLFLQYVGHPHFFSWGFAHPTRQPLNEVTPADIDLEYEVVSFETADGLTLHGWYIPSHNGAAIMLYH